MPQISYTQALRDALREEMQRDERVFIMGEDIGVYGGAFGVTRGLLDEFGTERVRNTPISEAGFTGAAIGSAMTGMRPVVEIMFMDFMPLVMDQLLNQACKLSFLFGSGAKCPLVIRTPSGAGKSYGPTHSQSLENLFLSFSGLKIAVPGTASDAKSLLKTAIRDDGPVLFVENKTLYPLKGEVSEVTETFPIPFGKANTVVDGEDLTIVCWSAMRVQAELAATELETHHDIFPTVLDLRTLAPMDIDNIVASVTETGRLLIVEEGPMTGGVGAEISARIFEQAHDYLDAPIKRLAYPDIPVPAAPHLEKQWLPDKEDIVKTAIALFEYE